MKNRQKEKLDFTQMKDDTWVAPSKSPKPRFYHVVKRKDNTATMKIFGEGRKEETEYKSFAEAVKAAEAEDEVFLKG